MTQSVPDPFEVREIKLPCGKVAIVSAIDWDYVAPFKWYDHGGGYVRARIGKRAGGDGKIWYLHRFLMQPPPSLVVDHIDGNPLNNSRQNLQIVTQSRNCMKSVRVQNASGAHVHRDRWRARIRVDGKAKSLGVYDTAEEAAAASMQAREDAWTAAHPIPCFPRTFSGADMAENSKIEWTTHTFNPWIGCTKMGPPCDGCYAEAMMDLRYGRVEWGAPGKGIGTRLRTSTANWRKPFAWDKAAKASGERTFVFCASLADIFDNQVDPTWRADAFDVMRRTPNLTYLLLTKRPSLIVKLSQEAGGLPMNAAIGATMASQSEYDRDRMKLAEAKAMLNPVFSFGSFEPLLGPVILDRNAPDWIIVGGETDQGHHKARFADPDWMRSIRDQARELGRAFFMKQMTRKAPIPDDLLVRQWPLAA